MSSRRSARISGTASLKIPAPPITTSPVAKSPSKKPITVKAANISKKRKATESILDTQTAPKDAVVSTPKRKRASKPSLPPVTPTPAAIGLMSLPYGSGDVDDSTPPPPVNRLALPGGTNASLVTPETHRLIANKSLDEVSPSKVPNVTTTTTNILDEALEHLIKVEPKLKPVIEKHPCRVFSPEGLAEEIDPFRALISGIISQQVSGAAAKSIQAKFVSLFNPPSDLPTTHTFPAPSQIVTSTIETLCTAGLSKRKAEYIFGLAEKFHSGEITTEFLFSATYEEVLEELIKVRGLGKWSVEMFACFGLKMLDVFSTGDLGVQRGMAALMGRDVAKLKKNNGKNKWKFMSEKEMLEISEKFKPYRSVFMWYMWRVEDVPVDISTLEG